MKNLAQLIWLECQFAQCDPSLSRFAFNMFNRDFLASPTWGE